MEGFVMETRKTSVPAKVKRKVQQDLINKKNFFTVSLEQIALILKDIKDANRKISTFNGVFQSNSDYIQIADILFTNLSVLGKLSTRKIPELERIKEDALQEIENSIRNLDLKLKRNYENSFGRFRKSHKSDTTKTIGNAHKLSKQTKLAEAPSLKSDTAIDERAKFHRMEDPKEYKSGYPKNLQNKQFASKNRKYKSDSQFPMGKNYSHSEEDTTITEGNSTEQKKSLEMKGVSRSGNFKEYVESIVSEDINDVETSLCKEMETLKKIESRIIETVEGQERNYSEPIEAASNKIYNDLKCFKKINKSIEETVNRIEKFNSASNQTKDTHLKPEVINLVMSSHSNRLKVMERVAILLMKLQVLFLVLIVEIPLLVLFVMALVWR